MTTDVFLKFEGGPDARGESLAEGHKDEIEILSFSCGVTNSATHTEAAGITASRAAVQSFALTKVIDRASPVLFQACCSGSRFRSAILTVRAVGTDTRVLAQYKLEDVLVDSIQQSCGGDRPMESFSLAFAKLTVGYRPQSQQGMPDKPVFGGWDVVTNKASASPLPMR